MALQNQLVFILLCLEIAGFLALVFPLPFTWRRAFFKVMSNSPLLAKLQYALKITFIFVALLFADAVNHLIKIQKEGAASKETGVVPDAHRMNDFRSRKFLSERNFYLCGFTLFLSLILSRTYSLVLDLIKTQEDLAILQAKSAAIPSAGGEGGSVAGEKEALAVKQLAELQKEYDVLSLKYAKVTGATSDKRVD